MNKPEVVFLLYGGSSPDGRGSGKYKGMTYDPQEALDFFYDNIANSSLSTGSVKVYTEEDYHVVQTKMNIKHITKYIK